MPATTSPSSGPRGWVPDAPAPDDGRRARVLVLPLPGAAEPRPAAERDRVDAGVAGAPGASSAAVGASRARHRAAARRTSLVPGTVRGGRWRPTPAAAAGAAVVLVVLAVALALRSGALDLVGGPSVPDRAAVTPAAGAGGAASPPPSPSPSAGVASGPAAGAEVVVHVVGEVSRPGLVRVPAGSRVADAVQQAGGAGPLADLTQVNLARAVVDGEQVVLPRQGETVAAPAAPVAGAPGAPGAAPGPLDLNAATLEQLDGLDGIGPVLARRILDWRTTHGRFSAVDELGEVEGIGDKLLDRLRDQVRV